MIALPVLRERDYSLKPSYWVKVVLGRLINFHYNESKELKVKCDDLAIMMSLKSRDECHNNLQIEFIVLLVKNMKTTTMNP
jgi:hypothetical protein